MAISDFPLSGSEYQSRGHLTALTQQVTAELRSLLAQRSRVMKRVAELRRVVCRLEELYGQEEVSSAPADSEPGLPRVEADPAKADPGFALHRACRIALMEIDGPASASGIYGRIVRRGSFQFSSAAPPLATITTALNEMVNQGNAEIVVSGDDPRWRWRPRSSGEAEAAG